MLLVLPAQILQVLLIFHTHLEALEPRRRLAPCHGQVDLTNTPRRLAMARGFAMLAQVCCWVLFGSGNQFVDFVFAVMTLGQTHPFFHQFIPLVPPLG